MSISTSAKWLLLSITVCVIAIQHPQGKVILNNITKDVPSIQQIAKNSETKPSSLSQTKITQKSRDLPTASELLQPNKNFEANRIAATQRRKEQKSDYILIHHSGMTFENTKATLDKISRELSAHFLVTGIGEIIQVFPTSFHAEGTLKSSRVWKADRSGKFSDELIASPDAELDLHAVQVETNYAPQLKEAPTTKEVASLGQLIAYLASKNKIPPTHLLSHTAVQPWGSSNYGPLDGRSNEPSGIMYKDWEGRKPDPLVVEPNVEALTKLVSIVRSYGVWLDGNYAKMPDYKLAELILYINLENAARNLDEKNPEIAQVYRTKAKNFKATKL